MPGLQHEVRTEDDAIRVVLEGELDLSLAPALRRVLHGLLARAPVEVIVDLGKVPFVDSSILATLIEAYKLMRERKGTVRVANCQPAVRDVLELARVGDLLGCGND